MKRYSARVVEEAAQICAIAASNNIGIMEVSWHVHVCERSVALAFAARMHALFNSNVANGQPVRAEAEALLRCGWRPS